MSNYTPKKLGTLERMDKFLETCKLPRLNHEETENLNRLLLRRFNQSSETCRQKPSTDGFKGEFYQTFKELILIHLKLFPKIAKEGKLVKSFYKASITLASKLDKAIQENYRATSLMNTDVKILNKILAN